jgi:protein-S-isoprenylcysteine O-methyltransferase Ste14
MALNWNSSRIGLVLALVAIGLALANWNAKPAAAWAWAAAIVILVVMVAVHRRFQLALSRSPGDAASVRSVASVAGAVVFGALMMIIPLALTLAHAYGLVDDPDSGM